MEWSHRQNMMMQEERNRTRCYVQSLREHVSETFKSIYCENVDHVKVDKAPNQRQVTLSPDALDITVHFPSSPLRDALAADDSDVVMALDSQSISNQELKLEPRDTDDGGQNRAPAKNVPHEETNSVAQRKRNKGKSKATFSGK